MAPRNHPFGCWLAVCLALVCLVFPKTGQSQCSSLIDLNTWTVEGPAANGSWIVNALGTQVTQNINGLPTFFVSPQEFINVRMTGTIRTTGGDDDFIGFVFGYQNPIGGAGPTYPVETWLFDWKRGTQNVSGFTVQQGRYLSQINGNFNLTNQAGVGQTFWGHQNAGGFNVAASTTGGGTGWAVGTTYDFELTYLATRTVIVVNNDTFFDFAGCFEPGRFGFYNYSQNPVVYSNFSYQLLPNFSMASDTVCLTDSARFQYTVDTCSSSNLTNSVIASWQWDFGDGNTSTSTNPAHVYAAPGTYSVKLIVTDSFGCQDSLIRPAVILPVPPAPVAAASGPHCEGATLNLTGSGIPGVTYNWTGPNGYSSNLQNPNINPVAFADSGNYILTVTQGGCTSLPDTALAVIFSTPPAPVATSNGPVCEDSLLTLGASAIPGASYSWTGPNGFASVNQNPSIANPSVANSGVYSVTATVNGCTGPAGTVNVTVNPTPSVNITGDSVICIGDGTTLTGTGANTYVWSTGPLTTSISVAPLVTTTYSVVGTSALGCPAPAVTRQVVVNALPVVSLGNDTTVCDSLVLDAGAGFLNYNWSNGSANQTLTVSSSGNYQVTVMNVDSCLGSDTINVTVNITPTALISGDSTICPGGSTTLNASGGGTYLWNTGSTATSILVNPAQDSTYSLVTTANGCSSPADTFRVYVGAPAFVNLGADTVVCDQMTLDAGGGFLNYLWNNGSPNQTIPVNTSGTYFVAVMNPDSCVDADTINVIVNNTIPVDLGPDQNICPGTTVNLVASPGFFVSYLWSNLATVPSISVNSTGQYSVGVIDANGCPSADTINVSVYPQLSGFIGNDTTICDGSSIVLNAASWGGASYLWTPGGATTPSITVSTPGNYSVQIDDGNGCLYTDAINVAVDVPPVLNLSVNPSAQCSGEAVTFSTTPSNLSNYAFFNGATPGPNGPSSAWVTNGLQNGNSVTVIATTANGCLTNPSAAVSVNILPRPTGTVTTSTVCQGDLSTLTVNTTAGATITWSGSGGLTGSGSSVNYVYPAAGQFPYLVVIDNGVCDTTIAGNITVTANPPAPQVADITLCEGEDALFTALGSGGLVEWFSDPAGNNLLGSGYDFPVNGASSSDTFFVRTTLNGCEGDLAPVVLNVGAKPRAEFISVPDTSAELNAPDANVGFANLSTGATTFFWNFGDGATSTLFAPEHNFPNPGEYTVSLIAVTPENCRDTFSLGTYRVIDLHNVFVPTGFTPNADGMNDFFEIKVFGIERYDLDVFDRWGKWIFSNGGATGTWWDGQINGQPAPEGVYVYKLRVYLPGGEIEDRNGSVTLIR